MSSYNIMKLLSNESKNNLAKVIDNLMKGKSDEKTTSHSGR